MKPPPAASAPAHGDPPKNPPAAIAKPSNDSDPSEPVGHILAVRPLSPVIFSGMSASESEVRRLPPVDRIVPAPQIRPLCHADDLPRSYPATQLP